MQKLNELEKFYETKIAKDDLVAAINSLGTTTKVDFELFLKQQLNIRDYILTFLSNVTTFDTFLYVWKSFTEEPNEDIILGYAYKVIRDKFNKKGDVGIALRHFLAEKQNLEY